MDDTEDLSPAERRLFRKALQKAFAKGKSAGEQTGYARGKDEARQLLSFAANLNGSAGHVLKALGDSAQSDDAPEGDPNDAIAQAMLEHALESLEEGESPAAGLEALRGLLDNPDDLARVLGDGDVPPETVAKACGWMLIRKAWDEATDVAVRDIDALALEMLGEMADGN